MDRSPKSAVGGDPNTLVDLFEWRVGQAADATAYAFVRDDLSLVKSITYAELSQSVHALAAYLSSRSAPGSRVLLLYGPGFEFVRAFWACVMAGLVAVPVSSPDPSRIKGAITRLRSIMSDADASLVLTDSHGLELAASVDGTDARAWVATDAIKDEVARFQSAKVAPNDLCYLQYTSGSTSTPRGVMISHANALANLSGLSHTQQPNRGSRLLSWLPHFHDYGLVYGILWPLYAGMPAYLMSPLTFLRRPLRWLEAIDHFAITFSGAPNFAYASCLQALARRPSWSAHLESWQVASCGAEPIQAATMSGFVSAFKVHGFGSAALAPAYGLAETTLLACGRPHGTPATLSHFDSAMLSQSRVLEATPGAAGSSRLVSSGRAIPGMTVRVVDPITLQPAPADAIGEIWLAGSSVGQGYWNKPEATASNFGQPLGDAPGFAFLRTGDLGFIHQGEVFITGRLKDMVIVHGRNIYPQDVEWTVEHAAVGLRAGYGAVFGVDGDDGEKLVVVQEVERSSQSGDLAAIAQAIRSAIAQAHELPVHAIALVRAGAVPRTTSGKIQRQACRASFLDRSLPVLWMDVPANEDDAGSQAKPSSLASAGTTTHTASCEPLIIGMISRLTHQPTASINPNASAIENGLHSLTSFQLLNELESALGLTLPITLALAQTSLRSLAHEVDALASNPDAPAKVLVANETAEASTRQTGTPQPLSAQQEGVWLAGNMGAPSRYHLAQATHLLGPLDVAALESSFQTLIERHESLRTAFVERDGIPEQLVLTPGPFKIRVSDLSEMDALPQSTQVQQAMQADVSQAFDLAQAPLLRVHVYRTGAQDHHVLIVIHHLVSDGRSASMLLHELSLLYQARVGGPETLPSNAEPNQTPLPYADYVMQQRHWLRSTNAATHQAYWHQQLRDVSPLALATDRPRPARPTFRSATLPFEWPAALFDELGYMATTHKVSLFAVLLSAFQTLMLRYTHQDNFAVASPIAGRIDGRFATTLGLFTNTLVLRADVADNPRFADLLARVWRTVLNAYEHQAFPTDRIVAELGQTRDLDRPSFFQVGMALQNMGDTKLHLHGLDATPLPMHTGTTRTDLWISFQTSDGLLRGEIEYATDLFDQPTIERLSRHLLNLLRSAVARPEAPLSSLAILDEGERQRMIGDWNATQRNDRPSLCVHEHFEAQVLRTPDHAAVVLDDQSLTYDQLNRRANRLAHRLKSFGVGPDVLVAICMQRCLDLPMAMLAVMKAGGAFVPLDPDLPRQRLATLIADTAPAVLLTHESMMHALAYDVSSDPQRQPVVLALDSRASKLNAFADANLPSAADLQHSAYVIFTSGSTGSPKGVVLTHLGLANHMQWELECLGLTSAHRMFFKANISFDGSIYEVFAPLLVGGALVLAQPGEHRDIHYLVRTVRAQQITHMVLAPSAGRALLHEPTLSRCTSLIHLTFGGEALACDVVREFRRILPGVRIGNFYGPSETTITATHHEVLDGPVQDGYVPIGRPISNVHCHVLDPYRQPVPAGVVGELYIGGLGLARGYLNQAELTAKRFVADPFRPGQRLYRTGDLARYSDNGELHFVGRADTQVKIRGHRIEPGEVEATIRQFYGVRETLVVAHNCAGDEQQLTAFVVGEGVDLHALRLHLLDGLPSHMVPTSLVAHGALPVLPNGKLDRRVLLAAVPPAQSIKVAPPRNELEQQVLDIWHAVLRVSVMGVHDNFFELGGHSLIATQVVARIRSQLNIELPLRTLFDAPTVAGLAQAIQTLKLTAQTKPLEEPFAARDRSRALPLSYSQRRMWLVQQMDREGTAYNMPFATRLRGHVDGQALGACVKSMVTRHEAFRTSFELVDGVPMQRIAEHADLVIDPMDVSALPIDSREAKVRDLLRETALRPFDLTHAPLMRISLIRLDDADHVLLFLLHHAIGDQWSAGVLAREFTQSYQAFVNGREPQLKPLSIQYADYAAWQLEHVGSHALEAHLAYWRLKLAQLTPLSLPTDFKRPALPTSRGAHTMVKIPSATLEALQDLSAAQSASLFMVFLAAFKVLLARYSGQHDIAIGTPIANRTRTDTENLIGTMVNTLVLRTDAAGDPSFVDLLARVKDTALQAYDHQDYPYEHLVEALRSSGDADTSSLVQVLFNMPNAPGQRLALQGAELEPFEFDRGSAQFDLSVTVDTEYFHRIHIEYSSELFEPGTVQRLAAHYLQLLGAVASDASKRLSQLSMLTPTEHELAIHGWNRTQAPMPAVRRASELITQQALRTPHAVAVRMEDQALGYAELDQRSNQLANHLATLGVGRSSLVGVCMERSPDMLVAVLAVMKCGAAYVPLDPAFPSERLAFMAHDARLALVLTRSTLKGTLPFTEHRRLDLDLAADALAREDRSAPPALLDTDDLAYVLYTSGSTGKPKGVEIDHRALINFLISMQTAPGCEASDKLLAVTTLSFDIAGLELLLPLTVGACVDIAPQHDIGNGHALMDRMVRSRPTLMQATPSTWRMLIDAGWQGDDSLVVLCGGEALGSALAAQLLPRCKALWNLYGPTETTIWSTLAKIDSHLDISIGRPIANTSAYLLDGALQPVPVGVPGEIYIGGAGVARGYRNRDELTQERFVGDPFAADAAARIYRTGDMARYLPDGRIVHLGRSDFQVKIRGYRIELGEIETVLTRHPKVAQCVVCAKDDADGTPQLVAYVIPHAGMVPLTSDLRLHLRASLPDYMTPSHVVYLTEFPLTANNKVNMQALPAPRQDRTSAQAAEHEEPRSTVAVQLTALWCNVLADDTIGMHDDFFERGGHSLKAIQLLTLIEGIYGRRLPLATLIEAPTVAKMEQALSKADWVPPWRSLVAMSAHGSKTPLFIVPGVGGNVLVFARLAALLRAHRPVYGLQAKGLDGIEAPFTKVEAMAAFYVSEIRSVQAKGPYCIGGTCTGGVIAFEMARQLRQQQETVALAIIESWHPTSYTATKTAQGKLRQWQFLAAKGLSYIRAMLTLPMRQWPAFVQHKLAQATTLLDRGLEATLDESNYHAENVVRATLNAIAGYHPQPYPGRLLNIVASARPLARNTEDTRRHWESLAAQGGQAVFVPAQDSGRLFVTPFVEGLADQLDRFADAELGAQ